MPPPEPSVDRVQCFHADLLIRHARSTTARRGYKLCSKKPATSSNARNRWFWSVLPVALFAQLLILEVAPLDLAQCDQPIAETSSLTNRTARIVDPVDDQELCAHVTREV